MTETTTPGKRRFLGLPTTRLGRVAILLFALAVVIAMVAGTFFEDERGISVGNLNVVPAITLLALLATIVTGAIALIKDRERSWVVWLVTLVPAIVVGAELVSMLVDGY